MNNILCRFFALMAISLAIAGCSMSADTSIAESEVPRFHRQLNAQELGAIYDNSASEMKEATGRKEFIEFLQAVHRKLGVMKTTERQNWHVNYGTNGTVITLVYNTSFTEGEATEQFLYRLEGKTAKLMGYNINSNAFILK